MVQNVIYRISIFKDSINKVNEDGKGSVLFVVAAGWFLSIGIRLIYPIFLPYFQSDFGVDLTTAGLLVSVLWFTYAIGQLPGGLLSDKIGPGRVLLLSTLSSAVAITILLLSVNLHTLFIFTGVLGICTALYGPARFPLLTDTFSNHDGTAIGITQAAGNLGNSVLPVIAGILASIIGWRTGIGFVLPIFIFVIIGIWKVVPMEYSAAKNSSDTTSLRSIRSLLKELSGRNILVMTLVQVFGSFIYQGFTSFYPTYLIQVKSLTPSFASGLFGLFFAIGMITQPATGAIGDRYGEKRTLIVILSISVISFFMLPFITNVGFLIGITIILSSLLGRSVLTLTYLTNALSDERTGTGLGLLRSVYLMIGSTSPLLIGSLANNNYFDESFLLLGGASLMMVLLCLHLPD